MSQPIAFILLQNPVKPNVHALVETMRQRHPDLPWDSTTDPTDPKAGDFPFVRCGRHFIVLMSVAAPLPNDENLWSRAATVWPEARETARRHRAHLVVSTMSDENELEAARVITAIVGGLIMVTQDACGVVWRSQTARSPQIWAEMSRNAFAPYPNYPYMLWIDIAPFRSGQSVGAFTIGLRSFTGREMEFEVAGISGPGLIDRVAGLAVYLIERGDTIKDGDTVGGSEHERIKAYHRVSRFNAAPVLAVGSEDPPPGRLKTYPIIAPATARDHPLLILLTRVGLFDASSPENQISLQPDIYDSEQRLESYDGNVTGFMSRIVAGDAYVKADGEARTALARGDTATAKSLLLPFAELVRQFQAAARGALSQGKLYLFLPKQS
jgi:Domain of unknown function (DUF4261)